jgi:hypothetical protein
MIIVMHVIFTAKSFCLLEHLFIEVYYFQNFHAFYLLWGNLPFFMGKKQQILAKSKIRKKLSF